MGDPLAGPGSREPSLGKPSLRPGGLRSLSRAPRVASSVASVVPTRPAPQGRPAGVAGMHNRPDPAGVLPDAGVLWIEHAVLPRRGRRRHHRHEGDNPMTTAMALPGNTPKTFLVHDFGSSLEGDDRFVVERLRALADGDIRSVPSETPGAKGGASGHDCFRIPGSGTGRRREWHEAPRQALFPCARVPAVPRRAMVAP